MFIESMASSIVVGKIRGGKIKNIGNIVIKKWYLFIIGFGLEFLSVYLHIKDVGTLSSFVDKYFIYIHSISYALIFIGLIFNFSKKSMILVFLGTLLNYIVIISNGGQMPVSGEVLSLLGMEENLTMLKKQAIITHTLITENTRLVLLGDIIPAFKHYPFPKILSIGDIFIYLGIFFFLQHAMLKQK